MDMTMNETFLSFEKLVDIFNEPVSYDYSTMRKFGNYQIPGESILISKVWHSKLQSWLYFNKNTKAFYLVKKYDSGKYHIDFFKNVVSFYDIDFINGTWFDLISECIYEDCEKFLYFHYQERMFRIVTKQDFKLFSTDFKVNFGEK